MTRSRNILSPSEVPDLNAALSELAELMLATATIDELLNELAHLAAKTLVPSGDCGITLRRDNEFHTSAASGPMAAQVDEVQYGQGDGPSLQVMASARRCPCR